MAGRSWSYIVDATVKRIELAAALDMAIQYQGSACEWLATTLREMARIADRDAKDRAACLMTIRFLGLKFTIARDG